MTGILIKHATNKISGIIISLYAFLMFSPGLMADEKEYLLSTKINEQTMVDYLIRKAKVYMLNSKDSAIKCATMALEIAKEKQYKNSMIDASKILADIKTFSNSDYEAIGIMMDILDHLDKEKDQTLISKTYLIIAEYNRSAKLWSEAMSFLEKGRTILLDLNDSMGLMKCYDRIAAVKNEMRQYRESIKYADTAINYCMYENLLASPYTIIGANYSKIGQQKLALKYHQMAYDIRTRYNDSLNIPNSLINLGVVYINLEDYDKALEYFHAALKWGELLNINGYKHYAAEHLSTVYEKTGNYRNAYKYLKKASDLRDVLYIEERNKKIAALLAEHDIEKTRHENLLLKKDIELTHEMLNRQAITILSGFLIITLTVFFTAFLYRNRKKILKDREKLRKQNDKISELAKELQNTNNKLRELDNFKENMVSTMVHDLKNPLNNILNISNSRTDKQKIELMQQSGKQMLDLVSNILDVSRYENSEMKLYYTNMELKEVMGQAIKQVEAMLEQKNISIKNNVRNNYILRVDSNIIERVLINMLSNAIKYSPPNANIELYDEYIDEYLHLKVVDFGPGIDKEKEHLVFTKFAQIEAKKAGLIRSTGIGLYFCKLAIKAHGGSIGFKSDPGKGTEFWITLPLQKEKIIPQEEPVEFGFTKTKLPYTIDNLHEIQNHVKKLKQLKIYEVTAINNILDDLKNEKKEKFLPWIENLKDAVYSCNYERYTELLNPVDSKK